MHHDQERSFSEMQVCISMNKLISVIYLINRLKKVAWPHPLMRNKHLTEFSTFLIKKKKTQKTRNKEECVWLDEEHVKKLQLS